MRLYPILFCLTTAAGLAGCSASSRPSQAPSTTKEAWDAHSDPKIFGLKTLRYEELSSAAARQGSLPHKPWTDSYWPYYKKDMAWRYTASGSDFASAADQIADANGNPKNPALSPAEKYDLLFGTNFALTNQSWAAYSVYQSKYGDDLSQWSWMGICNGWAPASLSEPAPAHNVLATTGDGKEILFYEGDIRGLLSKAYDLNKTQDGYKMVGSRCDADEGKIPRDAGGRPVDGRVITTGEMIYIVQDYSLSLGALEVERDPLSGKLYWLLRKPSARGLTTVDILAGTTDENGDPYEFYVYDSREKLAADAQANTRGKNATSQDTLPVELFKGCRDVNPASIHVALVQMLSDSAPTKASFVTEISRTKQVWNHPLWGFTTNVSQPQPVALESADHRIFRSPGTAFTANVTTRLVYVGGVQPTPEYTQDADEQIDWTSVRSGNGSYNLLDLHYTLEFDAAGYVIGGEWQESPDYQIGALDFFWRTYGPLTDTDKNGNASILKYTNVKKLLDCSQGQPDTSVAVDSGNASAVRCQF